MLNKVFFRFTKTTIIILDGTKVNICTKYKKLYVHTHTHTYNQTIILLPTNKRLLTYVYA